MDAMMKIRIRDLSDVDESLRIQDSRTRASSLVPLKGSAYPQADVATGVQDPTSGMRQREHQVEFLRTLPLDQRFSLLLLPRQPCSAPPTPRAASRATACAPIRCR